MDSECLRRVNTGFRVWGHSTKNVLSGNLQREKRKTRSRTKIAAGNRDYFHLSCFCVVFNHTQGGKVCMFQAGNYICDDTLFFFCFKNKEVQERKYKEVHKEVQKIIHIGY